MAVAVVGVVSYLVLPPRYESSVVISLPVADDESGLGMSPRAYKEFALSSPVMATIDRDIGPFPISDQLRNRYDLQLSPDARLLAVTASAQSAEEAFNLSSGWVDAFYKSTLALIKGQIADQKANSEQAVEGLVAQLTQAEDELATFDRENSISLKEARLSGLEAELVGGILSGSGEDRTGAETRLCQLTLYSIPTDEARLAFLTDALTKEPETLDGVNSNGVTILNPVYLQLSRDSVETRTRLVTNRREVESLGERIISLQDEIEQLRTNIVTSETQRKRLDRTIEEIETVYEPTRAKLDLLLAAERRLPELSRPGNVSEAVLPQAPVAPRKVLNMTLACFAAGVLGVSAALFLELYRTPSTAEAPERQRASTIPSTRDSLPTAS